MVRAAGTHGSFLKVGSNLRHFPNVARALELVARGAIGEVLFLRGWIGNDGWSLGSWWRDPDLIGGGTLLDNGSHLLDLTRSFLGEPEECVGYASTLAQDVAPLRGQRHGRLQVSRWQARVRSRFVD